MLCSCDHVFLVRLMSLRVNWRLSLKERVMPRGISNGENKDGVYLLCVDEIQLR